MTETTISNKDLVDGLRYAIAGAIEVYADHQPAYSSNPNVEAVNLVDRLDTGTVRIPLDRKDDAECVQVIHGKTEGEHNTVHWTAELIDVQPWASGVMATYEVTER